MALFDSFLVKLGLPRDLRSFGKSVALRLLLSSARIDVVIFGEEYLVNTSHTKFELGKFLPLKMLAPASVEDWLGPALV